MITVKRLTLEDARIMLAAAETKAKEIGVAETICVCDDGAHPIALHRMTGARITGVEIAMAKAFTAAGHRRATHKFNAPPGGPALPGNEAFGIHAMHPGRFAIFVGGFPIEVEGEVVVSVELEVGLLGPVGGGGESVGAEADPGEEGDERDPLMDQRVEEVLGSAEEQAAQSPEHGGNLEYRSGRLKRASPAGARGRHAGWHPGESGRLDRAGLNRSRDSPTFPALGVPGRA